MMTIHQKIQLRHIMVNAWKMYKRAGYCLQKDFAYYLKLAWLLFKKKLKLAQSKIVGVTFSNSDGIARQLLLRKLSRYPYDNIRLVAIRETTHDPNGIRIDAAVLKGGSLTATATIGYINNYLAKEIAPLIDENSMTLTLFFGEIKQRYGYSNVGCSFYYIIA